MMTETILLIEDDESGRVLATTNLSAAGYNVDEAADGAIGIRRFDPDVHRLVVTDLRMPNLAGLEVLERIHRLSPETPVIVITAFGSIELAVDAMKKGAFDFIQKPFGRDQLLLVVGRALEFRRLKEEADTLRRQLEGVERPIIFESELTARLIEIADRVARTDVPVLITGELGVGKELIARRIHARSQRSEGPFVSVSCAAAPPDLLELELFGGERDGCPCTGKLHQVNGGTLFLDGFSELSPDHQRRLVRAIDDGELDASDGPRRLDLRLVCASDRDLRRDVEEERLREDLLQRLQVVELRVPPLRERPEDVLPLARYFVERTTPGLELSDQVAKELLSRRWVGNVRELENACERMVVLAADAQLRVEDLPAPVERDRAEERDLLGSWPPLPEEGLSLVDLEKQLIERVLALKSGNITHAAAYLKVPRHVLSYRMEKYGLR